MTKPKILLKSLFKAAVDSALPSRCLPLYLPNMPIGKTVVIGAGKAAASMAVAVEDNWSQKLEGLVITRYGHKLPTKYIEVVQGGHPIPDSTSETATKRIIQLVEYLESEDLVICLISGGGSALMTAPADSISLLDKQQITNSLLKCGASISEINCVRKHLSSIKGGRLAKKCYPAKLLTLAISDVPGDVPSVIASGPTIPDPTTLPMALEIIRKYDIKIPYNIQKFLLNSQNETPKSGDPTLSNSEFKIIARPSQSIAAAEKLAKLEGLNPINLGENLEGRAREMATQHAAIALRSPKGTLLLSGGESTVEVSGSGRGGRNSEYGLALAETLNGARGIYSIACDTDGIDGTEDNAGVIITPDTLSRALGLGLCLETTKQNNDSYSFFKRLGDLVITGPTLTNVNDFRAILILEESK